MLEYKGYTRFEKTRIISSRALQISMGAPTLSLDAEGLVDPLTIATQEFDSRTIPMQIQRFPHAFR